MAKGNSGGVVKHPIVNDINAYGDDELDVNQKKKWLQENSSKNLTDEVLSATIKAAEHYSTGGFGAIHNGKSPEETELIDAMIEDPKAPVYGKNSYRGIHVSASDLKGQDPKEWIESIIAGGVWNEPGVTSFSADKKTAMSFGHFPWGNKGNGEIHILITNHGHTKGMPFKHISKYWYEDEVLQSSKTMKEGMAITGYHTNKAGNEYFIEVDDSIPVKKSKSKKKS